MRARTCAAGVVIILSWGLTATATAAAREAGNGDGVGGGKQEAEAEIRKTVDDAFAVLRDKSLAGAARRSARIAALRKVADRLFDWSELARSSLGGQWRSLNARQRARFVEVFKNVLAAQYMDDIDRFQGSETVTVDGSERQGDDVQVRTTLTTASRERVPINYQTRPESGRWMVVDLSIEGVSLVNHFRTTFADALANMTVDQLIDRLQKQLPASKTKRPSKTPASDPPR